MSWSWLFYSYYTYAKAANTNTLQRQQGTHCLLGKKANFTREPITSAMTASRKLQLLESDSITSLALLLFNLSLWIVNLLW